MADNPLDNLRLSFMQEVLPVGIAILERVRKGGASNLVEVFSQSEEPLKDLRKEGESSAKSFRDQLDNVSPGRGNPVVSVDVEVEQELPNLDSKTEEELLLNVLERIEGLLSLLENYLGDDDEKNK